MPNRRRRKLSTAMSAVAALAVASPCAYFLVYESTVGTTPLPEHHQFKQAAAITDLPNEVMSALSQGLSQFGVNVPSVPALNGAGTGGASLDSPALTTPGLSPTTPGLTTLTPMDGDTTNPALTNPALTSPAGINPNEVPIGGSDGSDGTYPILGDPSVLGGSSGTGTSNSSSGSTGLAQDVKQIADQLGINQAIDLIKGLIMQSVQNGGAAAADPPMTPPV